VFIAHFHLYLQLKSFEVREALQIFEELFVLRPLFVFGKKFSLNLFPIFFRYN